MLRSGDNRGFSLIEVTVGVGLFLLFALGIYSTIVQVFKMTYRARLQTLETILLSEQMEVVRNLTFGSVGTVGGIPLGVLPAEQTITRNGSRFTLSTTVRNIDDPYDGTLGGNPDDTAPADYKLVEMSILCVSCDQTKPATISTWVAPKTTESETLNGSLIIMVADAQGLPVGGANVHIENRSISPSIIMDDVTGATGKLQVIDTPTGTLSYAITVTKSGYSSDYTVSSSPSVPNPTKLPATVASLAATNINFEIDRLGSLTLHTVNASCNAVGSVPLRLRGQKIIGTQPDVYKYDQTVATNGGGSYSLPTMEWDAYVLNSAGASYDLAGTIPLLPLSLLPGSSQEITAIVASHASNSLLVKVKDAGTGLPLSGAAVRLTSGGYDKTVVTGFGFALQTDWSGGGGQNEMGDSARYWSDNGGISANTPTGDVLLQQIGQSYVNSGWLESSTFDLNTAATFNSITFTPAAQPPAAGTQSVLLQLASSGSSTPASWDFRGPDGTDASYYTATSTLIQAVHNGDRFARYRVYLSTLDPSISPQVSDVAITYTNACTAPGQSFFGGLGSGTYTLEVTHDGYSTNSGQIAISGNGEVVVNLSPL